MNGLRSYYLDKRVETVLPIVGRNRPRNTKFMVEDRYLDSRRIKVFRDESERLVLIEVEVRAWGSGKPIVRHISGGEIICKAAHDIARDIKIAGGYLFKPKVENPSYIHP